MKLGFELPQQPAWITCADCGELRDPAHCEMCARKREAARQRLRRERALGFPARFDWVNPMAPRLGAPDARDRVRRPAEVDGQPWSGTLGALLSLAKADCRPCMTLCGPAGSGKTSLAVAIAKTHPVAFYASAAELERDCQAAVSSRAGEPPSVARARECRVLVLDDLGKEAGTKLSPVAGIIQARHDRQLRTLVTTGLDAREVLARYDDGIARRVFESASALVIRWR